MRKRRHRHGVGERVKVGLKAAAAAAVVLICFLMWLGQDGGIAAMREKPELNFLTNTGVYVVEPRVVEEMRDGETIGFPDVIDRYRAAGEKVGVYPINESAWMDMGQMEELEKMRRRLEGHS